MINLAILSTESFVTFILAVVFSIISLGLMIFYIRKSEKLNTFWNMFIVYIMPAISTFLWLYLILSLYVLSVTISIIVSLIAALVIVLIMYCIEKAVNAKKDSSNK